MARRVKRDPNPEATAVASPPRAPRSVRSPEAVPAAMIWLFGVGALFLAWLLYSPALNGPFLFDDIGLPFYAPSFAQQPLKAWLSGVRPVLMFSYWINFQISGRDPFSYHALNLIFHAANAALVFALFRRLLALRSVPERKATLAASIGACLFLLHPLQTEAVAYIAGRSELVCGLFVLMALTYYADPARTAITWRDSAVLLVLYGIAVASKEQAVVLPAVFLGFDLFVRGLSPQTALRQGARLYLPLAAAAAAAVVGVLALLSRSATAGFSLQGLAWYEYLYTQFRVWLIYLRLTVLPLGQTADYDLPISHTIAEHGSAFALIALLIIGGMAFRFRSRFPLAFFGLLAFALFLAPTSTVVPLQDLAAERRMYLPLAGLLMVALEALTRSKLSEFQPAIIVGAVLICSVLTWERSKVWGDDVAFWSDNVKQSPLKQRGYTHLMYAMLRSHKCGDGVKAAETWPAAVRNTPEFAGVLGNVYLCAGKPDKALSEFERAVTYGPSAGRYLNLAAMYRQVGRVRDAESIEAKAIVTPPKTAYDFTMMERFNQSRKSGAVTQAPAGVELPPGGPR